LHFADLLSAPAPKKLKRKGPKLNLGTGNGARGSGNGSSSSGGGGGGSGSVNCNYGSARRQVLPLHARSLNGVRRPLLRRLERAFAALAESADSAESHVG
jgi:hypothetical protein